MVCIKSFLDLVLNTIIVLDNQISIGVEFIVETKKSRISIKKFTSV